MLTSFLLLSVAVLPIQDGTATAAPSGRSAEDLDDLARAAAHRYESLLWRLVPTTAGGRRDGPCDERIGRFCFWYSAPDDTPDPPPEPEPEEVEDARTVAVRTHRLWFSAEPSSGRAAGALLRYLIDSGRSGEAVAAARAHAWAADRSAPSLLLVGLALHENGEFAAAEAVFDSARAVASPEQRRKWDDVRMLLEREERGRYDDLSAAERDAYHERLWALSDVYLLQPGNERRSGHYARHAWAAIQSEAPRVRGKLSWGSDHEEILLRYGLPTGRKRIRDYRPGSLLLSRDPSFVENFAAGSLSLVPPAMLSRGLPELPPPGVRHEMERDTAPSAYAPVRPDRVRPLDVQVTRFPRGVGGLLRVDALLPPDTIAPIAPHEGSGLLAVLDTMGREVGRAPAEVSLRDDSSAVLTAELALDPGTYFFRIELVDDSTGLAGLAQGRLEIRSGAGLALSDLVAARPFGDSLPDARDDGRLEPFPSLLLPQGSQVGFYAEVHGLARQGGSARYQVEWSVESAEEGSLLGRAARWIGRKIGVIGPEEPVAIRWEDVSDSGTAPVAVTMDLADAEPGLYRAMLTLTDRLSGERRTAERLLRIQDPPRAAPARFRD